MVRLDCTGRIRSSIEGVSMGSSVAGLVWVANLTFSAVLENRHTPTITVIPLKRHWGRHHRGAILLLLIFFMMKRTSWQYVGPFWKPLDEKRNLSVQTDCSKDVPRYLWSDLRYVTIFFHFQLHTALWILCHIVESNYRHEINSENGYKYTSRERIIRLMINYV